MNNSYEFELLLFCINHNGELVVKKPDAYISAYKYTEDDSPVWAGRIEPDEYETEDKIDELAVDYKKNDNVLVVQGYIVGIDEPYYNILTDDYNEVEQWTDGKYSNDDIELLIEQNRGKK